MEPPVFPLKNKIINVAMCPNNVYYVKARG